MAKRGRPSKLVPERVERLLEALRAGNYIEVAVTYAGLGKTSFYHYLELGAAHKEGKYTDFLNAVKKAEADAEARQVAIVSKAAIDTWQAAAWLLERKHPDRWGQKSKTEMTGPGGGPLQVEVNARQKLIGLLAYGAARVQEVENNQQALGQGSDGTPVRLVSLGTPEPASS